MQRSAYVELGYVYDMWYGLVGRLISTGKFADRFSMSK